MSGSGTNPSTGGVTPPPAAAARSRRPDVRDLVAQSALPPTIRDTIISVVGRTRLRRGERFEIARELITHFEDGLAAGRESGELIASFGDPRQAAALIRRARRRQRPLIWWAWRRTWQGAAALVGLILVLFTWSYIRMASVSPTISRDYLAEMNARAIAVPEDERAWPLVREAMLAINADRTDGFDLYGVRSGEGGWDTFRPILESHAASLDLLRAAAHKPGLGYLAGHQVSREDWPLFYPSQPYEPPSSAAGAGPSSSMNTSLMNVLLPHLSVIRKASAWLKSDTSLALERGDGDRAVANLQAMLALAEQAAEVPVFINQLVKIAILYMALNEIAMALHEHPSALSDEHLRRLAERLEALDGGGPITLDFSGERAFFHDLLQRTYSDDGQGDGRLTAAGMLALQGSDEHTPGPGMPLVHGPLLPLYGLLAPSRRQLADAYESIIGEAERESRIPFWQRGPSRIPEAAARLEQSPLGRHRYFLVIMLAPMFERANNSAEIITQNRDAVLTIIALERWRRAHDGVFPQRLEELVPTFLPALPTDRFTGQPLHYEIRSGVPRLWAVGTDLDDDGGVQMTYPPGSDKPHLPTGRWLPREEVERLKREGHVGDPSVHAPLPDADWVFWPLKD